MGLRFCARSGCLCASEMDTVNPEEAKTDARARRDRAIIIMVMAAFIAAPIIAFLLVGRDAAPRP